MRDGHPKAGMSACPSDDRLSVYVCLGVYLLWVSDVSTNPENSFTLLHNVIAEEIVSIVLIVSIVSIVVLLFVG